MQLDPGDEVRNVVPRWRAATALPDWEIAPARNLAGIVPLSRDLFADDLEIWRNEGSVAAAVDIYDTGIILSDQALQLEAGGRILVRANDVPPKLLESVRRSFAPQPNIGERRQRFAQLEQSRKYLSSTIRLLKKRIVDYPRDVVALLEIARLHVILGQVTRAENYIRQAHYVAPNSRLVLRAAVQFYRIAGDVGIALPLLWKSESIRFDPLLQSAEIAAADLASRGSRFASSALRSLKGVDEVDIARSELALAVATLEMSAGAQQRRVFQMVRSGLPHGTENAVAQAVWLGEQTSRSLKTRFPGFEIADDAFEAKTLTLFDQEQYADSVEQAKLWLLDQPFQTTPLSMICTCYAVYLRQPGEALPYAIRGVSLHAGDWAVLNAALLVFIRAGDFARAADTLSQLERLASNPVIRAFAHAGAGMLAFARGNIFEGRSNYEAAIAESRRAKRPDMIFSAVSFYLLGEAGAGTIDPIAIARSSEMIDEAMKRVPAENRGYCIRLWRSLKVQVDAEVEKLATALPTAEPNPALVAAEQLPNALELDLGPGF